MLASNMEPNAVSHICPTEQLKARPLTNLRAVCGNKLPSTTKEDDDECDMSCPGDAERTCGAGNRLAVYVSDVDAPPEPGAPPVIEGWLYAGCIK